MFLICFDLTIVKSICTPGYYSYSYEIDESIERVYLTPLRVITWLVVPSGLVIVSDFVSVIYIFI